MKEQVEEFRYWLCESTLADTKYEIDYDSYTKILRELSNKRVNYRMFNVTEMVKDFDLDVDKFIFYYYIVVDISTFLHYSDIC